MKEEASHRCFLSTHSSSRHLFRPSFPVHLHDILKQAVDPINTIGNAKYPIAFSKPLPCRSSGGPSNPSKRRQGNDFRTYPKRSRRTYRGCWLISAMPLTSAAINLEPY